MGEDLRKIWGAAAFAVATMAGAVVFGVFAVEKLTAGGLHADWTHCDTGRYGPGPCIKGSLVDVIAGSFVALVLFLLALLSLRAAWKIHGERQLRLHGTRVTGVVVANTRLTPQHVRVRVEVPTIPGLVALKQTGKPIPEGTAVTVAYDPENSRRRPVVLDDHASRSPDGQSSAP